MKLLLDIFDALGTIIPSGNPLSTYPQISKILDRTPSSVNSPQVIESP